jgi:hypothetical protein
MVLGSEIRDPEQNLFRIPDPGFRSQKGTGSWIRIRNTDFFIPKIVTKLSEIWAWDPRSEIRDSRSYIRDPESEIRDPGSRSGIRGPGPRYPGKAPLQR